MTGSPSTPIAGPRHLVVIGAAAGVGRWLGEHVLGSLDWESVTLVDASSSVLTMEHPYSRAKTVSSSTSFGLLDGLGSDGDVAVVIAVPLATLRAVAVDVFGRAPNNVTVIECSHNRTRADHMLRGIRPEAVIVGLHALFGVNAPRADGQTFVVCPDPVATDAHRWLSSALETAGGTVNEMDAARHDQIMLTVQTATHQALLTFADVVGHSGLDIEHDLWANRTPVFELLLALSTRVLAPAQDLTTASIQAADHAGRIAEAMVAAHSRLGAAVAEGDLDTTTEYLEDVRSHFSGGLFAKIHEAGALATSAVQSTRARVAANRRTNAVVGVRGLSGSDRLHVGRVVKVTPTSFVLDDLLVGSPGRAALLLD